MCGTCETAQCDPPEAPARPGSPTPARSTETTTFFTCQGRPRRSGSRARDRTRLRFHHRIHGPPDARRMAALLGRAVLIVQPASGDLRITLSTRAIDAEGQAT